MLDMRADLITSEIVRNGLGTAALEMNRTLVRTAHNPLLYEALDFGVGIVSADAELWADAPGVAVFCLCLPATIRTGLELRGADWFRDGDVVIHNDPYETGTHISDTCVYTPIFGEGRLIAFAIAMAHWADVGAKTPGGWCPDTTDVYQEGLCFRHQRLVTQGVPNDAVWQMIEDNVRNPSIVLGDLNAQIAACSKGRERVLGLCRKYGEDTVVGSMEHVLQRTEDAVRAAIVEIPDGTYSAETRLDHDGVDRSARPLLRLTLTVAGDTVTVSFAGSSPTARGPINDPEIGAQADVSAALKGLLMPADASNGGHFRPIEFESAPDTIVGPRRPAPCDSYGYVGVALNVLTFRALAAAIPELCPAGGYQLFGVSLFRLDSRYGSPFIFMGPISGGDGARPFEDGPVLVFAGNGDTPNTPVEILEARYPVLCERFAIDASAAGPGRFRGGFGVTLDYRLLEDGISLQLSLENHRETLAKGLAGGGDGRPSFVEIDPGQGNAQRLTDRADGPGLLRAGQLVRMHIGGGGGFGDPFTRDPRRVLRDVLDGLLSTERAREDFGVVIARDGDDLYVDDHATGMCRSEHED